MKTDLDSRLREVLIKLSNAHKGEVDQLECINSALLAIKDILIEERIAELKTFMPDKYIEKRIAELRSLIKGKS